MATDKRQRQKQGRQARLEAARAAQQRARRLKLIRNGVIGVVLLVGVLFFLASRDDGDDDVATNDTSSTTVADDSSTTSSTESGEPQEFAYGTEPCPAADGSSPQKLTFGDNFAQCLDATKTYTAVFDTSEGVVKVALDTTRTPGTVNSFVALARYKYYDDTTLFRTDPSIGIIQGGSPTTESASDPGPGFALPDEGGDFDFSNPQQPKGPFTYSAGDLVMARSAQPDGASAQFFFGVNDDVSNLDSQGVYVTFGRVSEGLEVLEAILALHQPGGQLGGAPSRTVTIKTVTIEEA
jgi:cyclophilin family peptidyl-prolyl cis-trans isomerase